MAQNIPYQVPQLAYPYSFPPAASPPSQAPTSSERFTIQRARLPTPPVSNGTSSRSDQKPSHPPPERQEWARSPATSNQSPVSPAAANGTSTNMETPGGSKILSCVSCHARKVKCDKKMPCSTCIRTKVQCEARNPGPPRKRKRVDTTEESLQQQVKKYEDLLRRRGVDESVLSAAATGAINYSQESEALRREDGIPSAVMPLMTSKGTFPPNTTKDNEEDEDDEDDEDGPLKPSGQLEMIPRIVNSSKLPKPQHPGPAILDRIVEAYINNFNPLQKIIHGPSLRKLVATHRSTNFAHISKAEDAVLQSVYMCGIESLSKKDFESIFKGESRKRVTIRAQEAARIALNRSNYLRSSDIQTLQAFALYLAGTRRWTDPIELYSLCGLTLRIARRLGLHLEPDSSYLPLEAEMRRRTWALLVHMDIEAGMMSGINGVVLDYTWDCRAPLNINDEDITPEMTTYPPEREGLSDMVFMRMRHEAQRYMTGMKAGGPIPGCVPWQGQGAANKLLLQKTAEQKEEFLRGLEALLENKIVRFCEPINPLQTLTATIVRAMLCGMRLTAFHPRQYHDMGKSLPQVEKDRLFALALKIIKYTHMLWTNEMFANYLWHCRIYFQWQAFILLLVELRVRTTGPDVDLAWRLIDEIFLHERAFMVSLKRLLRSAIGTLVMKAWEARIAAVPGIEIPGFVAWVMHRRKIAQGKLRNDKLGDNVDAETAGMTGGRDGSTAPDVMCLAPPSLQSINDAVTGRPTPSPTPGGNAMRSNFSSMPHLAGSSTRSILNPPFDIATPSARISTPTPRSQPPINNIGGAFTTIYNPSILNTDPDTTVNWDESVMTMDENIDWAQWEKVLLEMDLSGTEGMGGNFWGTLGSQAATMTDPPANGVAPSESV